jgi:hypothetical protein
MAVALGPQALGVGAGTGRPDESARRAGPPRVHEGEQVAAHAAQVRGGDGQDGVGDGGIDVAPRPIVANPAWAAGGGGGHHGGGGVDGSEGDEAPARADLGGRGGAVRRRAERAPTAERASRRRGDVAEIRWRREGDGARM